MQIGVLYIFYNVFSKFVYHRISSHLFRRQCFDQYGCTPGKRIEDTLLCAEVAIERHQEFNLEVWVMSMEMGKAVHTIDNKALLRALRSGGPPEKYISLISILILMIIRY